MDRLISQENALLVRDDVGKAKPCTFMLPKAEHVYGKKLHREIHGVAVVTSSWETHVRSPPVKTKIDFTKVNKMTRKSGDYKVSLESRNH